jgi:hypothetical protein
MPLLRFLAGSIAFSSMRFPDFAPFALARLLLPSPPAAAARPVRARVWRAALRSFLCASLVAACSPAYNWRTVSDAAEGYAIDLPAKPTIDERSVDIAGAALPMHVRAARAEGAVFAIASIDLPRDDAQLRKSVVDALRRALARNVQATPIERSINVPMAQGGAVQGVEVLATGKAGDAHEQRTIHAWIAANGRHVYQAAIIAAHAPPQEQSEQFFGSLKLE